MIRNVDLYVDISRTLKDLYKNSRTFQTWNPNFQIPGLSRTCANPVLWVVGHHMQFSWPWVFLNKVVMLFIEENFLSHSVVDGQRMKVETQLLSY